MLNLNKKIIAPAFSLMALGTLVLTGCSANETGSDDSSHAAHESSSASQSAQNLSFDQTWVKAGNSDMTAAFGEVTNTSDQAVKIVSAESSVTDKVQLHTTEIDPNTGTSSMKQVDSFTVEPEQTFKLEPGGNHIMFMDMKCSLPAGHTVTVTLKDDQGNAYSFDAQARDYSGAKEEYAPGQEASMSSEMDHSKMDHSSMESDQAVKDECGQ